MIKYCEACKKNVEASLNSRVETFHVRDLDVTVNTEVYICDNCGNDLWDDEQDDANLKRAFEAYRKQKGLLLPDEIKEIRLMYGLTQKNFALILGLGEKTITRYENGSLQDMAQNNLILLMRDMNNFITIWNKNKTVLSEQDVQKVEEQLNNIINSSLILPRASS